jgi:hypothetical protein
MSKGSLSLSRAASISSSVNFFFAFNSNSALRVSSFFSSDFSLTSDWFIWARPVRISSLHSWTWARAMSGVTATLRSLNTFDSFSRSSICFL